MTPRVASDARLEAHRGAVLDGLETEPPVQRVARRVLDVGIQQQLRRTTVERAAARVGGDGGAGETPQSAVLAASGREDGRRPREESGALCG
jgi:hypothetical protein